MQLMKEQQVFVYASLLTIHHMKLPIPDVVPACLSLSTFFLDSLMAQHVKTHRTIAAHTPVTMPIIDATSKLPSLSLLLLPPEDPPEDPPEEL